MIFILSTLESCRTPKEQTIKMNGTYSISLYDYLLIQHENHKVALLGSTDLQPSLQFINQACAFFFIVELFVRFVACPNRRAFLKSFLNIVDIIIVCSLLLTGIMSFTSGFHTKKALLWLYLIGRGLIILRLLRLFRFAKHFSGLQIVYLALRASFEELGLLFLTFLITTSLFGALMFYAEFYKPTQFENVPLGIWWAVVTLTTVGYGDYYPVTTPGYIVGALCAMCGLLLLSMPIAIIATNFNDYYNQNKIREKQLNRKKDIFNKIRKLFRNKNIVNVRNREPISPAAVSSRPPESTRTMLVAEQTKTPTEPETNKPMSRKINVSFKNATAKVISKHN